MSTQVFAAPLPEATNSRKLLTDFSHLGQAGTPAGSIDPLLIKPAPPAPMPAATPAPAPLPAPSPAPSPSGVATVWGVGYIWTSTPNTEVPSNQVGYRAPHTVNLNPAHDGARISWSVLLQGVTCVR